MTYSCSMSRKTGLEILTNVGTALYGERWQRPLAKDLGIDEAQIRRWVRRGSVEPYDNAFDGVLRVMKDRETAIIETRHQLVRWLAQV